VSELLSPRGKITEDNRNKQLIITDVPSVIQEARRLVAILDTPERQVIIEARIVEASSTFGRDLGVKWGISRIDPGGDPSRLNVGLGGSFLIAPPTVGNVLGGAGMGAGITFGQVGIDSTVLDLRISALESSGHGKVISTPRVATLNGGQATISQGTKIPYQSSGSDGLPKTEFVDANLQLTVTPVINPDNSIILDINATNSSLGSTVSTGGGSAPAIDTKEAKTKLLVRDGETTVIGGVFVETDNYSTAGVPLLMRIPILGHLFKSTNVSTTRSELLIFITPRIVN
jgi:type IV pilus assembly protein PilQ